MTGPTPITLDWIEWPFPDQGVGGWNAHVKFPDVDRTACGITTTLGKGVRDVGHYLETDRPPHRRCCRECLNLRRAVADRIRLAVWSKEEARHAT